MSVGGWAGLVDVGRCRLSCRAEAMEVMDGSDMDYGPLEGGDPASPAAVEMQLVRQKGGDG